MLRSILEINCLLIVDSRHSFGVRVHPRALTQLRRTLIKLDRRPFLKRCGIGTEADPRLDFCGNSRPRNHPAASEM